MPSMKAIMSNSSKVIAKVKYYFKVGWRSSSKS